MKKDRRIGVGLAALAMLGGLWVLGTAQDTAQTAPTVNVPPTVPVGGVLSGDASAAGEFVEVEVFCDGQPVPGLFDDVMDGPINAFSFPIPESCRGKTLEVVATSASGGTKTVHVNVPQ